MKKLSTLLLILILTTIACPALASEFDETVIINDRESIMDYYFGRTGNTWQLYREDGTLFLDHKWPDSDFRGGFSFPFEGFHGDNVARIRFGAEQSDTYGAIDRNGQIIIEPIYETVSHFVNGLAYVCQDDLYGYANEQGEFITDFIYEEAEPFWDNRAVVRIDGKCGLIDTEGNMIIEPEYDWLIRGWDEYIHAELDGKDGCFYADGTPMIPVIYDTLEPFKNGEAPFESDGLWGVINTDGEIVVPLGEYEPEPLPENIDDMWSFGF